MNYAAPAFWVNYRGQVDPQIPLNTTYNYNGSFYDTSNNIRLLSASYSVMGPPQLTKRDYMEIKWSPMVGLGNVTISRSGKILFQSQGSEQGFRDEGQWTSNNGGVTNQ